MKLRFTPRAASDLRAISAYLRERDPAAALRVRSAISDGLRALVQFPRLGRQQREPGVRKFVTRRYSYLIFYAVEDADEEIIILTVQHSAQERSNTDA